MFTVYIVCTTNFWLEYFGQDLAAGHFEKSASANCRILNFMYSRHGRHVPHDDVQSLDGLHGNLSRHALKGTLKVKQIDLADPTDGDFENSVATFPRQGDFQLDLERERPEFRNVSKFDTLLVWSHTSKCFHFMVL